MELNKYSRGKIYRIVSNVSGKEYIGSTIMTLSERMAGHRKNTNTSMSRILFEEDGIENCRIVLIENYPCDSKEELLMRERYYIETRDCINKQCPIRSSEEWRMINKEWRETHKEYLSQHNKKWREENKEILQLKRQVYINTHKEQVKETCRRYNKTHKEDISQNKKEYYDTHKEQIKEYKRQYYHRNKHGLGLYSMGL